MLIEKKNGFYIYYLLKINLFEVRQKQHFIQSPFSIENHSQIQFYFNFFFFNLNQSTELKL